MIRALARGLDTAYRFSPREPAWAYPFLRRFAERLARHPPGEAALIERTGKDPPMVVPASPSVARSLLAAADGLPGRVELLRPLPAATAGASGPGGFLAIVPAEGSGARLGDVAVPPVDSLAGNTAFDRRLPPSPFVPDEGMGSTEPFDGASIQCHWWSTGGRGLMVRVRLRVGATDPGDGGALSAMAASIVRPIVDAGYPIGFRPLAPTRRRCRAWRDCSLGGLSAGRPFLLPPEVAAQLVRPPLPAGGLNPAALDRHLVIVGASGSGKSSFLADLARRRIASGGPTIVFDVHGDLGAAIAHGLPRGALERLVAVDLTRPVGEIPGVPLFSGADPEEREREAAHLVAGFRHVSSDGGETFWGHRLEQVFDVFVRLVEEEGGGFADLFELLTDPARRDAVRFTTRSPVAARFLDELPALIRRNPEYLQPAVARVQKVMVQPKLVALFGPAARPFPLLDTLRDGRSIIWRVPSSEVGPHGCRFAVTMLASRTYLGLAGTWDPSPGLRALLVLDEAQAFAPTLLAELLSEGRKFGIGVATATQYAARLAPAALAAAVGAAGTHVAFRVPRAAASASGEWIGLRRDEAERLLPFLPTGVAVVDGPPPSISRAIISVPPLPVPHDGSWADAVRSTSERLLGAGATPTDSAGPDGLDERILLALVAVEAAERPGRLDEIVRWGSQGSDGFNATDLELRLPTLVRRRWIEEADGLFTLASAGARRLGLGAPSGAIRESEEHRSLLIEAFRIFARRGERLEFVRQGRFDTRLPDAMVRLLDRRIAVRTPREVARAVDARRSAWAWRAFGGRDIHVEAEVSGAERPERIRRGLDKARERGAAVVFVVRDARRAARVRAVLRAAGTIPLDAQVWTLSRATRSSPKPDEDPDQSLKGRGGPR